MALKLKLQCAFCAKPTNFKDVLGTAYCIDCHAKMKNTYVVPTVPIQPNIYPYAPPTPNYPWYGSTTITLC